MEKLNNEQAEVKAQSEQVTEGQEPSEKGAESASVSYGKFKDANALFSAYSALESEFTKRCQRVKELEAQLSAVDKEISPTGTDKKEQPLSEDEKNDVLKAYLKEMLSRKQRAIVLDGAGVGAKTPVERPRTLEQAGKLAKEILNVKL